MKARFLATVKRKSTLIDYCLAAILLAYPISLWYVPDFSDSESGIALFLTKLLSLLAVVVINLFVFTIFLVVQRLRKRESSPFFNVFMFSFSHCLGVLFLKTDSMHYQLFQEHWTVFSLTNVINGMAVGSAPLGLVWSDVIVIFIAFLFYFCLVVWMMRFVPKSSYSILHPNVGVPLLWCVSLLMLISSSVWLPSTFATRLVNEKLPVFDLVAKSEELLAVNYGLESLVSEEKQRITTIDKLNKIRILPSVLNGQIKSAEVKKLPDILMIHIEAFRASVFNAENTPNLYAFAQENILLDNHYSSSNNTPGSMFSLLSGLSASYYQYFRDNPSPLLPMKLLKSSGYVPSIFYSNTMDYENIGDLFFSDYERYHGGGESGEGFLENDMHSVNSYIKQIVEETVDAPRFDYMILDSSHYSYYYPKDSHEKYKPVIELGFKITSVDFNHLEKQRAELFNRYRNSIYYADYLFGKLVSGLEQAGHLEDRIIIIFGDHGEEFWEHQRFGHTFGLVNEQVKVAGVMAFPGTPEVKYRYTDHHDFMPTVLSYLNVDYPLSEYTNGKDLFSYEKSKDFSDISLGTVSNYKRYTYAVVGDDMKVTYKLSDKLSILSITTDGDDALDEIDKEKVEALVRSAEQRTIL